jgi:hypothetical protein
MPNGLPHFAAPKMFNIRMFQVPRNLNNFKMQNIEVNDHQGD